MNKESCSDEELDTCPDCKGEGLIDKGEGVELCPGCKGTGLVLKLDNNN